MDNLISKRASELQGTVNEIHGKMNDKVTEIDAKVENKIQDRLDEKIKKGLYSKGIRLRFRNVLLCIGLIPMALTVLILGTITTNYLGSKVKEGITNELEVAAAQMEEYFCYDILNKGDVDVEEYADHSYMKSLQHKGIEMILFKDNVAVLSSMKKADGSYDEGTLAQTAMYDSVKLGNDYHGENVKMGNDNYFVYCKPLYNNSGRLWGMAFAGEKMEKVTQAVSSVSVNVLILSIALLTSMSIIIILFGGRVSRVLKTVMDGVNELAEGKLDADFDCSSIIKEVQLLAQSGDTLQKQLTLSIGGAQQAADELELAVDTVNQYSNSSAEGATKISDSVNELSLAAKSMAETVQNANMKISNMGDSIDSINGNIMEMNRSGKDNKEANKVASQYMGKLEDASERTSESVNEIGKKISEFSESAAKINAATDAITEIASQTNLLSLNASIEAARAGDAGRGFAVVAQEIQKLADQSSKSAVEIQNIVYEILSKVDECVETAETMNKVIKEQNEFLEETKEKIADMNKAGDALSAGAEAIDKEALALIRIKEDVLNSISDLSAISEENAAFATEVSSTVETITEAIEATKEEANGMKALADELEDKMKFFKL
ncbi:MAG: methyl-accepting chemotaxis protein [Lachnospiraceae bacterium]|nr:methyl-accepting chemotaxis protein [Lachnospiraceae bacterium]